MFYRNLSAKLTHTSNLFCLNFIIFKLCVPSCGQDFLSTENLCCQFSCTGSLHAHCLNWMDSCWCCIIDFLLCHVTKFIHAAHYYSKAAFLRQQVKTSSNFPLKVAAPGKSSQIILHKDVSLSLPAPASGSKCTLGLNFRWSLQQFVRIFWWRAPPKGGRVRTRSPSDGAPLYQGSFV